MKQKIIIYGIVFLAILSIGLGIAISAFSKDYSPTPTPNSTMEPNESNNPDETKEPGTQDETVEPTVTPDETDPVDEKERTWQKAKEEELKNQLTYYMEYCFGKTHPWEGFMDDKEDFVVTFSIKRLYDDLHIDISMFNTDEVACDVDKTIGIINVNKDEITYDAELDCTYHYQGE